MRNLPHAGGCVCLVVSWFYGSTSGLKHHISKPTKLWPKHLFGKVMCIQQCVWCYVVKFRPHSTAHLQTFQNRSNHSLGCVLGRVGGATGQILVMLVSSQGTQRSTAKLKHKCGNKGSCNAFPSRTSGDATADFSTVYYPLSPTITDVWHHNT